jgi:hypothetical protein
LHDVPVEVYTLLEEVAARAPQPLTVILERDGAFPRMDSLLAQLDAARAAITRGRARQTPRSTGDCSRPAFGEACFASSLPVLPQRTSCSERIHAEGGLF